MKRIFISLLLALVAIPASAQLIYGNTFPFWNVNGPLAVTGLSTMSGGATITGTTSIAAPTVTGTALVANATISGHLATSTTATSIVSGNCGTTTNGTVSGTDQAGLITIGSAATTACKVTFGSTFAAAPKACIVMAANAGAIAATTLPYISTIATTYFTLTGAVLASTSWYYMCL